MSVGILCDHCRAARTEAAEMAGWLVLTRLTGPPPQPVTMSDAISQLTGQEPRPPVERGVHFCSTECLISYVQAGMHGLLEAVHP